MLDLEISRQLKAVPHLSVLRLQSIAARDWIKVGTGGVGAVDDVLQIDTLFLSLPREPSEHVVAITSHGAWS